MNKEKYKKAKSLFIGFLSGILNGFFGSGGGSLAVPLMTGLTDLEDKKAHATAISIIIFLTGASLFVYFKKDFIDLPSAWRVIPGGILGGLTGAFLLKKCPVKLLRKVFGTLLLYAGYRMFVVK
ncbi:MAG TPA: sulfite exporter TauE/SafE family protein [Clostridiales bacterium]|nr:sulfite exporter TauE/SafE family protein [Clostridiales bacterium]